MLALGLLLGANGARARVFSGEIYFISRTGWRGGRYNAAPCIKQRVTPIVANFRGKYRLAQVYHICGPADHVRAKVPNGSVTRPFQPGATVVHDLRPASGYNLRQSIRTAFGAGFGHEEFSREKIH